MVNTHPFSLVVPKLDLLDKRFLNPVVCQANIAGLCDIVVSGARREVCGLFMPVSFPKLLVTRSVWRVKAGLAGFAQAFQDILKSVIAASLTHRGVRTMKEIR